MSQPPSEPTQPVSSSQYVESLPIPEESSPRFRSNSRSRDGPLSPTFQKMPADVWDLSSEHHSKKASLPKSPSSLLKGSNCNLQQIGKTNSSSQVTHHSKTKLTLDIIRKLPKAELHRHLDGSVRVETIIELAKEQGVDLPSFDVEELRKLVSVTNDCTSLVEYLRGFDISLSVMQKRYSITQIAWRYRDRGVCAFDLAGPENGFSSKNHASAFELVHRKMLNCTLHSGEASGWESIQDSIRYCGANRIGHGTHLKENPDLTQYVANHRIPIEICITSNLQTKAIQKFEEHPVREFFDYGIVLVPCTDNTTVSNVTLSEEYLLIQNQFGFDVKEIVKLIDYGFRSAFLDLSIKNRLRADALHTIQEILSSEGYDLTSSFSAKSAVDLGFDFNNRAEILPVDYDLYKNETIRQFINSIPKADVNCRFNGSVSVDTLWTNLSHDEYSTDFLNLELELLGLGRIHSKNELECLIRPPGAKHDKSTIARAIQVMSLFLQTKSQIIHGCEDILEKAAAEHVFYLELQVRPTMHTKRGLSAQEVLDVMVVTINECSKRYNIQVGLVVYGDFTSDGLDQLKELSLLTIRNKKNLVGFGFFGYNDEKGAILPELIPVFNMLKNHQINVCCSAGFYNPLSVIPAIHDVGASRLSGCFSIHSSPSVMSYLCDNGVPIEISMTDTLKNLTKEVNEFAGSAVRLFLDRGIKVAPCSLDLTLYDMNRSENIYLMSKECNLSLNEVVQLMLIGFRICFQNYWTRKEMFIGAYHTMLKLVDNLKLTFDTDSFSLFCSSYNPAEKD
ncbi:predicted protein [Naegleria gruberi]|uniref:adenosine deaminase n=1 Tax=Naegleria gruberi TaxID=5762 RepID=D2VUA6_NAEGR|nr:uncharacterized protein NAEGRDRAFT_59240 [Naegleria gruberi]EFC39594.1 predicted protein [Naegleria gruberi]|eukprot:XP_002672338.1 predicted protein [Naegleria gruberi strain NEG-M]